MDEPNFSWKEYSASFSVDDEKHTRKIFGKVKRKTGKVFYRHYSHIVENGRGMSFLDIFAERVKRQEIEMVKAFSKVIFNG
jgi:hypothetical protein